MFLLAINIPRWGFSSKFLMKYGAALGLGIIMTETSYMTNKSWGDVMPQLAEGYRNLPIIIENPRWWFAVITDGFGSHNSSLKYLKIISERKCVYVKEKRNYSCVNQAYNSLIEVSDIKFIVEYLSFMRRQKYKSREVVNKWSLTHVGLHMIWNMTSAVCIGLSNRLHLHQHHRLSFLY